MPNGRRILIFTVDARVFRLGSLGSGCLARAQFGARSLRVLAAGVAAEQLLEGLAPVGFIA